MIKQVVLEIEYLRYNLIFQATDKQNRDFGNGRKNLFARPYLMTKAGNIFSGWNDTVNWVSELAPHLSGIQYLGIISLMDVNVFSKIIPAISPAS